MPAEEIHSLYDSILILDFGSQVCGIDIPSFSSAD